MAIKHQQKAQHILAMISHRADTHSNYDTNCRGDRLCTELKNSGIQEGRQNVSKLNHKIVYKNSLSICLTAYQYFTNCKEICHLLLILARNSRDFSATWRVVTLHCKRWNTLLATSYDTDLRCINCKYSTLQRQESKQTHQTVSMV